MEGRSLRRSCCRYQYLANRAKERGEGVVSIALHPGNISTEIFRDKKTWYMRLWVHVYCGNEQSRELTRT